MALEAKRQICGRLAPEIHTARTEKHLVQDQYRKRGTAHNQRRNESRGIESN